MDKFEKANVVKVNKKLGLVFGYAIVCKEVNAAGVFEDHYDLQGDHIPEDSMLEASADFMLHSRAQKDMHQGEQCGDIVFAFPMTTELAKALDITVKRTGLIIAMKPHDKAILDKYEKGEYTGFSIGGQYIENETLEA